MKRTNRPFRFGPKEIKIIPRKEFKTIRPHTAQLADIWEIIGPSVELNLDRLPLWKVITMAYIEGCYHGQQLAEDTKNGL